MRVCAADELAPGQMVGATLDSQPIVVLRTRAGELQAYVDRCLHQGARLSGGRLLEAVDGDEVGDYRPRRGRRAQVPVARLRVRRRAPAARCSTAGGG